MNVTVNLSFQDTLLKEIDAEAKRESRSRSELLREASRLYIQRQMRWKNVFAIGDAVEEKFPMLGNCSLTPDPCPPTSVPRNQGCGGSSGLSRWMIS